MNGAKRIARNLAVGTAVVAASSLLGGCKTAVLDPHGPIGVGDRLILLDALGIMMAIVVPTMVLTLVFAWWFRASNTRAKYTPDWDYSAGIEFVVWIIPALVVLFLGGVAWFGSHELDPFQPIKSDEKTLEVQVVSLDWKWLFIYPEQNLAAVNELYIPTGVPVHFTMTSATVMNALFVPQLGSMIYTMPGMTSQLNLLSSDSGTYPGISAQFSGDGYSDMGFTVHSVSADDFKSWVDATHGTGQTLDTEAYTGLEAPSSAVKPYTFGEVSPGLFEQIINLTAQRDPAPAAEPGAAAETKSES